MDILRLDLGSLVVAGLRMPVYAFALTHHDGVVIVDTGLGGPRTDWAGWQAVARPMVDALADHGLHPTDVRLVINTHLHMDHCGANPLFKSVSFWMQRAELTRAREESPELRDTVEFPGAHLELLEGDCIVVPGVRVVATPGHTVGHQSVVVDLADGFAVLLGDAAYTRRQWRAPEAASLPPGQAADIGAWRKSIAALHALDARTVYFAHDEPLAQAVRTIRPTDGEA